MSNNVKIAKSRDCIVMIYEGRTITLDAMIHRTEFARLSKVLMDPNAFTNDMLIEMFVDVKSSIEEYSSGFFTLENGQLKETEGGAVPNVVGKQILKLKESGADFGPLMKFYNKLSKNPSAHSRDQLYAFMEHNDIQLTESGDMVFEKGVSRKTGAPGLWDCYTGTVDNSIGQVVTMDRDQVTHDPTQACSQGLHVAPPSYVRQWYTSGVIVEVSVNPTDVVSVPNDYDFRKVRVCRYKVEGIAQDTARLAGVVQDCDFITEDNSIDDSDYNLWNSHTNATLSTVSVVSPEAQEIEGMTAQEIINYVKEKTNHLITINLKNKAGIKRAAVATLEEYNAQFVMSFEEANERIAGMTGRQMIAYIKDECRLDLSDISLKNKKRIVSEAIYALQTTVNPIEEEVSVVEEKAAQITESCDVNTITLDVGLEEALYTPKEFNIKRWTRREMISSAKTRFNEKIGGLVTTPTVRKRLAKLLKEAGYTVIV